ncbi:MAG: PAS domain S-box protein [Bacteroidales bacterium]|nr:PAS domain S-box protein [Bacteroidales bacterium]
MKKSIIILITFLYVSLSVFANSKRSVLFINSFSIEGRWSRDIYSGIYLTLKAKIPGVEFHHIDMDSKNIGNISYCPELSELIKAKYGPDYFDAVIVASDNALEFAVDYKEELFPNTPIVFCSVFKKTVDAIQKRNIPITGEINFGDLSGNFKMARELFPDKDKYFIINDEFDIGTYFKQYIETYIEPDFEGIKFIYSDAGIDDIKDQIEQFDDRYVVFLGAYERIGGANVYDDIDVTMKITSNEDIPVFAFADIDIENGVLGGLVVSGKQYGIAAANRVVDILNNNATDTAVIMTHNAACIFDYNVFKEFELLGKDVPHEITFINREDSFLVTHLKIIIFILTFITILIVLIIFLIRNIRKRIEAEQLIRENTAKKYNEIIENSLDGILIIQDGIFVYSNKRFCDLTGFDYNDIIGMEFHKLVAPMYKDKAKSNYNNRIQGKDIPKEYEIDILDSRGSVITVWLNAAIIEYNGKPADYIYIRDITKEKEDKQKVVYSEIKYRSLFENAPVAIIMLSKEVILDMNPYAIEMFGAKGIEEFEGKGIIDISAKYQDDGMPANILAKRYIKLAYEGKQQEFNWVSKTLSGTEFQVSVSLSAYNQYGTDMLFAIVTDLTERIESEKILIDSEEKYRSVFNNSHTPLLLLEDVFIVDCNMAAIDMFKAKDKTELIGKTVIDLSPMENADGLLNLVGELRDTISTKNSITFEWSHIRFTGEVFPVIVHANKINFNMKDYLFASIEDLTDKIKAQRALLDSEQRYKTIFEESADAIIVIKNNVIFDCNGNAVRLFEVPSKSSLIGMEPLIYSKENSNYIYKSEGLIRNLIDESVGNQGTVSFKWTLLTDNGREVQLKVYANKLSLNNDELIIARIEDLTDIIKSERKLKDSEKKYRRIFDNSLSALLLLSDDIIVDCNPSAVDLFGKQKKEDLIGKHIYNFSKSVQPDGVSLVEYNEVINREIKREGRYIFEWIHMADNGDDIPCRVSISTINLGGELLQFASIEDRRAQYKAEQELQEKEERYRTIFENALHGFFVIDNNNKIYECNTRFLQLLDYTSNTNIIGREIRDISYYKQMADMSVDEYIKYVDDEIVTNGGANFLWILKTENNRPVYVNASVNKMTIKGEGYQFCAIEDISDKLKAEQAFKDSEERYRKIFQNALNGFIILNKDNEIVDCNPQFVRMMETTDENQIIGRNLYDISDQIQNRDQNARIYGKSINRMVEKKGATTAQWNLNSVKGNLVITNASITEIWLKDEMFQFCTFDDVSEKVAAEKALKDSEEKLRLIFDEANIGIVLGDISGNVIKANSKFYEMLGYDDDEELPAETKELLSSDIDTDQTQNKYKKGDVLLYKIEKQFKKKDGTYLDVRSHVSARLDVNGNYHHFVSIIEDYTEKKNAEMCLVESQKVLKELNATKDRFFSIIAHDLKNPFNTMLGFSELLINSVKEYDYDKIEHYSHVLHKSTRRGFDLLNNLLEWSRSQMGMMKYTPKKNKLSEIFKSVILISDTTAKKKGITINYNIHNNEYVFCDINMINAVIRNLVSNAIKFTKSGGNITISTNIIEDNIKISVKDTGVGMSAEVIEKLFKLDSEVSSAGTEGEKGTGLGLILCNEFIKKHGRNLDVTSIVGEGSEFVFYLPICID